MMTRPKIVNEASVHPDGSSMISREENQKTVAAQWADARRGTVRVTCPCGHRAGTQFLYRCLYCGIWFCQSCAEEHFGETRIEHTKRLYPERALIG